MPLIKVKTNNNEILGININEKHESDDALLAEYFNDYFINIASNLKEPLRPCDFTKLKNYINSKVPENLVFDLPYIDQNFVYNFLSSLDTSKATGLDGIGPRLLKFLLVSFLQALHLLHINASRLVNSLPCGNKLK